MFQGQLSELDKWGPGLMPLPGPQHPLCQPLCFVVPPRVFRQMRKRALLELTTLPLEPYNEQLPRKPLLEC